MNELKHRQVRRSPRAQDVKKFYRESSTSGEDKKTTTKPKLKSPKKKSPKKVI